MADGQTPAHSREVNSSDERIRDMVHVKQPPPPQLFTPRSSSLTSPASDTPSSKSPSSTSTGATAATSIYSPATLGATTKPTRAIAKKKKTSTSPKVTATASQVTMATISTSSLKDGTTPTQRVSRAKKGKRVHACNHPGCDKVFTRAEHLRRHQLNHSTEVFYKCEMCERTFVRQDLLSRHTERHATQAMKAVQTLALAQRHTGFVTRYGINGINGISARPPPTSDYGGNSHVFDSNPHSSPRVHTDVNTLPQILTSHSPHQSSPSTTSLVTPHSSTSMASYGSTFSTTMPLSSHGMESPLDYPSGESASSPSGNLRRGHLPFHLQHSEPTRQPEPFVVSSHPEILQRPPALSIDNQLYAKPMPTWENYAWLFDDSTPQDQAIIDMNRNQESLHYLNPLETGHYRNLAIHGGGGGNGSNSSDRAAYENVKSESALAFHPIDDRMRSQILMMLGNVPNLHSSAYASASSMQYYLRLYWTKFHPIYPVLHRPTFLPGMQLVMLVAIVIAIGASFADDEAHQFGMALYDKVKGLILNQSDDFTAHGSNSTCYQQAILLTDIFGKMRCMRSQFDGAPLDVILMKVLRQSEIPTTDPLEQVRRYHRDGMEFNYDSEWQHWIELESQKRLVEELKPRWEKKEIRNWVALLFFYWDVQQATMFGRDMCQTAFDLRVLHLPCKEFLWNADSSHEWVGYIDGQQEHPSFLETLRIFLDPKKKFPVLSPLSSMFILHGLISVGYDLHRRSSPIGPSPEETAAKQARLLRAYEKWATYYEMNVSQHLSQSCNNRNMVMYHAAYISLHTNIHNLTTVAGDTRTFKRSSERGDYYRAKAELQQWANSGSAQLATWHAAQILVRSLNRTHAYLELFHIPWCMYIAALVCWAYGQLSPSAVGPGGLPEASDGEAVWDPHQDMRVYLGQMSTDSWESLPRAGGHRRTAGLIAVVKNTLEGVRWGLTHGGVDVLRRLDGSGAGKGV